ncbi:hypothetical protein PoB_002966000 [Plakobranchus ocellatus]|uniref:Uncharacterized protein n=1 Tax=Plakobranchus ocellatus TaxID=259542 RepID=A0AAV4A6Z1_9GAST|nr:hypothetical protein PoB_002966000 [Plakobranchus ocellatus]
MTNHRPVNFNFHPQQARKGQWTQVSVQDKTVFRVRQIEKFLEPRRVNSLVVDLLQISTSGLVVTCGIPPGIASQPIEAWAT